MPATSIHNEMLLGIMTLGKYNWTVRDVIGRESHRNVDLIFLSLRFLLNLFKLQNHYRLTFLYRLYLVYVIIGQKSNASFKNIIIIFDQHSLAPNTVCRSI